MDFFTDRCLKQLDFVAKYPGAVGVRDFEGFATFWLGWLQCEDPDNENSAYTDFAIWIAHHYGLPTNCHFSAYAEEKIIDSENPYQDLMKLVHQYQAEAKIYQVQHHEMSEG